MRLFAVGFTAAERGKLASVNRRWRATPWVTMRTSSGLSSTGGILISEERVYSPAESA